MKLTRKVIFIILTFVLVITAFTVVALAADKETVLTPVVKYENDYDSYDYGTYLGDNVTKVGYFGAHGQEGTTDKYLLHYGKPHTTTNASSFLTGTYSYGTTTGTDANGNKVSLTNITNYPYAAFEFDIMKITDSYSTFSVGTYIKDAGGNLKPADTSIGSSSITSHLPSNQYVWSKVTVIFKYHSEVIDGTTTGYLSSYAYVNGEQIYKYEKAKSFAYDSEGLYSGAAESALYLTDLRLDTSSTYNTDGSKRTAFDNVKLTVYPSDYSLERIVSESYYEGYEFPYTKTRAILNGVGYESAQAAIDAAKDGDTVYLREDIDGNVVVDKAITIVTDATALSDENTDGVDYTSAGIIQDTDKEVFTFDYVSYKGYVAQKNGDTYTFTLSDQLATVNFDVCNGECDCYFKDAVGHILTTEALVPVGHIPEISSENTRFEVENGLEILFLGWTYTKGNTEPDTISPITVDDVANGVTLYPVYKITQYNLAVVNTVGDYTYYLESEFYDAVTAAPANSTVKLLTDVYTECNRITLTKTITIDLNGHNLNRCAVSGNVYEAFKSGEELIYDDTTVLSTLSTTGTFFYPSASNIKLTITSSVGGGALYNSAMTAKIWTYEGEVIKRTSSSVVGATLLHAYWKNDTTNFNLIMNGGITVCTGSIWTSESASASVYKIIMDDVYFNLMSGASYIFNIQTDQYFEITATRCIFQIAYNGAYWLRAGTNGNGSSVALVTFKDCDLIKSGNGWDWNMYNYRPGTLSVIVDNSRWFDYTEYDCVSAINGTLGRYRTSSGETSKCPQAAEGWEHKSIKDITISYTVPKLSFLVSDDAINTPVIDPTNTSTFSCIYNVIVTKPINVNWMEGEEIKATTTVYPGADNFTTPTVRKELVDDLYRDIIYQWTDKDGNACTSSTAVPADWTVDSYTFYAAEEIDGVKNYVAAPKATMFNLVYYGHLAYNLYTPVVDGVTIDKLGDYPPSTTYIDGVEYYVSNAGWISPQNAIDEQTKWLTYTIDGVQYSVSYKISALVYSNLLCAYGATDVELDAVKKLMAYAEEVYEFTGVMSAEKQTGFDTFFTNYNNSNRPDYITEYPDSEIHTLNPEFVGLVKSFGITIAPNNRIALTTTLTKEAVDLGYKVTCTGIVSGMANKVINDDGTVTYYTDNSHIVEIMSSVYTITILDSNNEKVASTDYSLATYIKGIEGKDGEDVAKALYTFGKAVIEVRKTLY